MKLNRIVLILTAITISFVISTPVYALSKEKIVYTNLNGVKFTEIQYNNLKKAFSEDTISTFTQEGFNLLANDTNLRTSSKISYEKTDIVCDFFGNVVSSINTVVSEKEAVDLVADQSIQLLGYPIHQTTMKKIKIDITVGGSVSRKTLTLTVDWLSGQMPTTRSHDVIALRPDGGINLNNIEMITGYLKHNGSIVQNYSRGNSNIRILSTGVGLSMPLPSGGTSMSHGLTVILVSGDNPYRAYGGFQHAQSSVTLADSKVYNLQVTGTPPNDRTNIIKFTNTTTAGKYDNMQSVNCTVDWTNFDGCN